MEDNDCYGLLGQRSGIRRSTRDGDFEEQDVWDVLDGYGDQYTSKINQTSQPSLHSPPRVIPRLTDRPSESKGVATVTQHSAPVNVPRIRRNKSKEATPADDDDDDVEEHEGDEYAENGSDENISPEKYFQARSRSPSFSVIEGIGRTLKGRDLSSVRNAVLKKTGFLE